MPNIKVINKFKTGPPPISGDISILGRLSFHFYGVFFDRISNKHHNLKISCLNV